MRFSAPGGGAEVWRLRWYGRCGSPLPAIVSQMWDLHEAGMRMGKTREVGKKRAWGPPPD